MSQPEHDMNRQVKRHKGPLLGYVAIFVFAIIITIWWLGWEFGQSDGPTGAETQIDSRTGETVDGPAAGDALENPPRPVTNSMGDDD